MTDFSVCVITVAAIAVILPLVFNLFYFLKTREEKKRKIGFL